MATVNEMLSAFGRMSGSAPELALLTFQSIAVGHRFQFHTNGVGDGDDGALDELDIEDLIEVLEDEVWISDDFWSHEETIASTSQMLDGAMFTHFVSPEEYALESVATNPDLEVIDYNVRAGLKFNDGGVVERIWPDDDAERADAHGSLIGAPCPLRANFGPAGSMHSLSSPAIRISVSA